jgi:cardiolipin synthase
MSSFWDVLHLFGNDLLDWLPPLIALVDFLIILVVLPWVLMTKTDSTSAVAWCLFIIFLPFFGALVFLLFGYQHVNRPLRRKRRHKAHYRPPIQLAQPAGEAEPALAFADREGHARTLQEGLCRLAERFDGYPLTLGNRVDVYTDGQATYHAMFEAIQAARHHVHLETYIFEPDETGRKFLEAFTRKAREGVQVRLLYDAMGSHRLHARLLRALCAAGGKCSAFLPVNPFRRRIQINLRNHRKILVVDGQVGFVGGLNIGDEHLGKVRRYGYWRDTHVRLHGPAVRYLQRVFAEDWDFASGEHLDDGPDEGPDASYFQPGTEQGDVPVQVIESGPDRELKTIREIYFAAILSARQRLWIASPYFVPDAGLRDALRLAGYLGVDVRFLGQLYPDQWIPQLAARYYWEEMLAAGVKVYQYAKGMMHSKVILVDGRWASVGTANLDNRSMHLNFEVNCLFYSPKVVAELEAAFLNDLTDAIRLEPSVYARRPFAGRLLENACRLLSPVL